MSFLPGDELLGLSDHSVTEKKITEIMQMLNAMQNGTTNEVKDDEQALKKLPVYVRTSVECCELIVKNTCNGMFRIQHADKESLNLMNSSFNKELILRKATSGSSIGLDDQESAWLIHTKGKIL